MTEHRKTVKHFNIPGHVHELTFSCHKKAPLLDADRTCEWLAEYVEDISGELDYGILAYVFMPEHIHLVVVPRNDRYDISLFLKRIKQPVSRKAGNFLRKNGHLQWLRRLSDEAGHFHFWQQGPGYDRNITEESTLRKVIDYVHENPVRRGLVECATDWKWSSARYYATGEQGPITIAEWPC